MPSDSIQSFSIILRDLVNQAVAERIAQPITPPPPQVFSANQVAVQAKVRRNTVTLAIRSGALPARISGKIHRINDDDLRCWIKAGSPVSRLVSP